MKRLFTFLAVAMIAIVGAINADAVVYKTTYQAVLDADADIVEELSAKGSVSIDVVKGKGTITFVDSTGTVKVKVTRAGSKENVDGGYYIPYYGTLTSGGQKFNVEVDVYYPTGQKSPNLFSLVILDPYGNPAGGVMLGR